MVLPTPDPLPLIPATIPLPEAITPPSAEATETADQRTAMPDPAAASRLGVAGWIVNDLGNTLFSQNMIANYFPVWVVAVMGAGDGAISLVNTVTMALMLGIGPWLGAVSDRLPRRLPILIVTTTGSCLLTFFIGNDLRGSLI
ncbi:MAG: hypothetical protein M3Q50_02315, partial [Chloroflexota bacterium]|nr:hypothetical protein [Chloroflexota bacterium]